MRFTLKISRELFDWLTEKAGSDDTNEKARRTAIRLWFYDLAEVEAPEKAYQAYPKANPTASTITLMVDLTEEAGIKICEIVGVDPAAPASEKNHELRKWLSKQAGLPVPLNNGELARERYQILKRKAEAYDALTSKEASDD